MASGAEPSMSREVSVSIRSDCGEKSSGQDSQCPEQAGSTLPKDSQDGTKPDGPSPPGAVILEKRTALSPCMSERWLGHGVEEKGALGKLTSQGDLITNS